MAATIRNWPYGFLDDFWWSHQDTDNPADTNSPELTNEKELIGSIEYVLAVCHLKEREIEVLRKRYQKHMTYAEIGLMMQLTGSYVRDICEKAMTKLRRSPFYKSILSRGVAAYARQRYEMRFNAEFNERVEKRVAEIRQAEHEQRMRKNPEERAEVKRRSISSLARSTRIGDLTLSVRSHNALLREGHHTVADILAIENREALLGIKNLGEKSANEIVNLLDIMGFDAGHLR